MTSPAKMSSSSPSSCKMNSHLKKSELNDPTRRSFSGNSFAKPSVITNRRAFNPTTPANSPSDFPRRHSTSRESVASLPDHGKENTRDSNPKPTSLKSSALSKGKKNFMSPTISTASKINTSPRKQILVERNESVQSSISFSNVKGLIMEDNESTPEIALQQQKASFSDVKSVIMKDTKLKPEIGPNQKKVSFSDVESIIIQGTESTLEISLNQVVSFSDVESVIMEDTDSKPDIGPNQKKVSFSDVESNGSIPEISLNQNVTFAFNDLTLPNSSHDSQISHHENEEPLKGDKDFDYKETENDSDPVPETLKKEKDSVNVDPTFKISPRGPISPSCPVLASFVSDPLMVPYDPKTNYLSPRPQFLHYRTNPRIELYREREGVQLDELYASESYSDTDVTAETPIEGSQRDLENVSSGETMDEEEDKEELHVSEPSPSLKTKRMSKPRFPTRSKFITLLLFLSFVCFSVLVVNSPAFTHGIEEISNYQVLLEISEFAKVNFGRFTQNLQQRPASFLSYVSEIVSGSREVHKLNPVQYANLSQSMEDHMVEGQRMFDSSSTEPIWKSDAGTELLDDKHYQEIELDEVVDEDDNEQEDQESAASETSELVSEQPDAVQQGIEDEVIESDEASETSELVSEQPDAVQQGIEDEVIESDRDPEGGLKNKAEMLFPEEVKSEYLKTEDPKGGLNNIAETLFPKEVKSENLKNEDSTDNCQSSEAVDIVNGQEGQFLSSNNVMGFSLLVLCLLVASAFIYTKRGKPEYSPVSVDSKDTILEKVSSKNWQTSSCYSNRIKELNEPCPLEMSSSERTSSSYSNKGGKKSNQYQSQERKARKAYRRESLASSDYSTGSPSYGSFTTYEKKSSKHAGRDDEIVTPVRRSSRIRSQVTSP